MALPSKQVGARGSFDESDIGTLAYLDHLLKDAIQHRQSSKRTAAGTAMTRNATNATNTKQLPPTDRYTQIPALIRDEPAVNTAHPLVFARLAIPASLPLVPDLSGLFILDCSGDTPSYRAVKETVVPPLTVTVYFSPTSKSAPSGIRVSSVTQSLVHLALGPPTK